MEDCRTKFQELLRRLFQFESADLDFGIYRIMNYKRDVIDRFIERDLMQAVSRELASGALAEQSDAARQLAETVEQVRETLGADALDGDGNLAERHHGIPLGKKYLDLQAKAKGASARPELEARIFNHLYAFFSRYYDDGDFLSKRRYSKKEKYAIPYNGEEVHLHWANRDQYYIKTGEYFTDYAFTAAGLTVHFKLQAAQVEQNNVKGSDRSFLPVTRQATFDPKGKQIVIPFEFRPLTDQEDTRYGPKNHQDAILAEALEAIPRQFAKADAALAALIGEHHKAAEGQSVSYLAHHLAQYAHRNTWDFFIHKDLRGFLERELDFYLKNEVLNLDDLEAAGAIRADGWFQIMRVVRGIGLAIIGFLAQIEDFQKRLFEKRKFVLQTWYCVTLGSVPESLHAEIIANDAQWQEWKNLFHIDEAEKNLFNNGAKNRKDRRAAFLRAHPTLVLDTRHFEADLVDRLLASFDDLEGATSAVLIRSENLQALNLLRDKHRGRIGCIHIDPPYNTQTSGFLYKNSYQHSSWLAMMENRIRSGLPLLTGDGSYLCHIDENEYERLLLLCDGFDTPNAGTIVWDKRNPMNAGRGIATQHEYIIWRSGLEKPIYLQNEHVLWILQEAARIVKKYGRGTRESQEEFAAAIDGNASLTGGEKAYRHLDEQGQVYQSVSLRAPEPRTDPKFHKPLIHPRTGRPCPIPPNGFSRTPETLAGMVSRGEILFGQDESTQPRQKVLLTQDTRRQISSLIQDARKGKADLAPLGLDFPYCHPVSLYEELLGAAAQQPADVILDYFAGSGTTGHAVLNLNRKDGGNRKFILVEMADCYESTLVPRIKKIAFAPEWRDGKATRWATSEEAKFGPRIIKCMNLESYEDALDNIAFDGQAGQQALQFGDYLLHYMLTWETKGSDTFLDVKALASPFDYRLRVARDGETGEKPVDLPETFNYLLGLHVQTRKAYQDKERRYLVYRGTVDARQVAVIWRQTKDWKKEDFDRDKQFVAAQGITQGADEVFVNSDSVIPDARSLDPVFKARMFAPVDAGNGGR